LNSVVKLVAEKLCETTPRREVSGGLLDYYTRAA